MRRQVGVRVRQMEGEEEEEAGGRHQQRQEWHCASVLWGDAGTGTDACKFMVLSCSSQLGLEVVSLHGVQVGIAWCGSW